MGMPLITKDEIVAYLRERAPQNPIVEVSNIYPTDDAQPAYGVYVNVVRTGNREAYQLGIQYCGSIYTETDEFEVLYITFQNDPQSPRMREVIEDMAPNVRLFDGYHEVTFTRSVTIGSRSEIHTYTFNCKRLEFNNTATN